MKKKKEKNSGTISEGHSHFIAGLVTSKKHIFLGAEWFVAAKIGGQRKKQGRRTHTLLPSRPRPDSFASHITDDLSGYRDLRNLKSKRCARTSKVIQIPSADINPAIPPTIEISRCLLYELRKCFRRAE